MKKTIDLKYAQLIIFGFLIFWFIFHKFTKNKGSNQNSFVFVNLKHLLGFIQNQFKYIRSSYRFFDVIFWQKLIFSYLW